MSYILEALRKAERERHLGQAPDVQALHAAAVVFPQRRYWPWLLGFGLLINAIVLAVMFWPVQPPVATNVAAAPTVRPPSVVKPPLIAPLAAPAGDPAPPIPDVDTTSVETMPSPPEPAAYPLPQPASTVVDTAPSQPQLPLLQPPLPEPKFSTTPPEPEPEPEIGIVELPDAIRTAPEAPPMLWAMPAEFRRSVPQLSLDIHVYSESPERRFALINSRRYREGDWMNEGPLLETITANGVILSFQGQRFMLPVPR